MYSSFLTRRFGIGALVCFACAASACHVDGRVTNEWVEKTKADKIPNLASIEGSRRVQLDAHVNGNQIAIAGTQKLRCKKSELVTVNRRRIQEREPTGWATSWWIPTVAGVALGGLGGYTLATADDATDSNRHTIGTSGPESQRAEGILYSSLGVALFSWGAGYGIGVAAFDSRRESELPPESESHDLGEVDCFEEPASATTLVLQSTVDSSKKISVKTGQDGEAQTALYEERLLSFPYSEPLLTVSCAELDERACEPVSITLKTKESAHFLVAAKDIQGIRKWLKSHPDNAEHDWVKARLAELVAEREAKASALLKQAQEHMEAGELQDAYDAADSCLDLSPTRSACQAIITKINQHDAHQAYDKARAYLRHGKVEDAYDAVGKCRSVVQDDKRCATLERKIERRLAADWYRRAKKHLKTNRYDAARSAVARCLDYDADYRRCQNLDEKMDTKEAGYALKLAIGLIQTKDYYKARDQVERCLKLEPSHGLCRKMKTKIASVLKKIQPVRVKELAAVSDASGYEIYFGLVNSNGQYVRAEGTAKYYWRMYRDRRLIATKDAKPTDFKAVTIGLAQRPAIVRSIWISFNDFYQKLDYGRAVAEGVGRDGSMRIEVEFADPDGNVITGSATFYP